ncbi:MAG: hypothetical protein PHF86_12535 [Candidatus Nanoarchaeia archaeon]|nr:hypothetical protein [Candidatus Nanoarchaeia archaeon]
MANLWQIRDSWGKTGVILVTVYLVISICFIADLKNIISLNNLLSILGLLMILQTILNELNNSITVK